MDLNVFGSSNFKTAALEQRDELTLLRINNTHADALIALQGAQLLEFTQKNKRPLIWLSEQAEFKRGQSVRGGIPVCWPWFGDIQRNPDAVKNMTAGKNLPAHGVVRNQTWILESIAEYSDSTEVTLSYATVASAQPEWPHDATLKLTIGIGKTLRLQLSTVNNSRAAISFTQALHTYFAISDIHAIEINGFDNTRYIDTLDDWREHAQQGAIQFSGETDRVYLDVPPQLELSDRGWQRRIALRTRNATSAIVWNPWIDKAQRLSQFADEAWQRMVCIETANALTDNVTLAPGAEHTLEVEITE
ncbi:MAG: aldose epimerase [Verrucomicrobiaceae bacterium]|nr:aldose epimerase [Verrucomicrobiaceae bacterium]